MSESRDVTWPRNWDGVIVWPRLDPDGGETAMFWSLKEQTWKPLDRFDVIMYSPDATEEELISAGLNPQDFK